MPINITELHPALLKSKEIATQQYVDDNSVDLTNYYTSQEVLDAIASDTTTIDGSRIVTGTIDASKIDASQLYVDAANITGRLKAKILEGAMIHGGYIEGAVIKTAYIDLEGDGTTLVSSYTGCTANSLGAIETAAGWRLPVVYTVYPESNYLHAGARDQSWSTSLQSMTPYEYNIDFPWGVYAYDACQINSTNRLRNPKVLARGLIEDNITIFKMDVIPIQSFGRMNPGYMTISLKFGDTIVGSLDTSFEYSNYTMWFKIDGVKVGAWQFNNDHPGQADPINAFGGDYFWFPEYSKNVTWGGIKFKIIFNKGAQSVFGSYNDIHGDQKLHIMMDTGGNNMMDTDLTGSNAGITLSVIGKDYGEVQLDPNNYYSPKYTGANVYLYSPASAKFQNNA